VILVMVDIVSRFQMMAFNESLAAAGRQRKAFARHHNNIYANELDRRVHMEVRDISIVGCRHCSCLQLR